MPEPQQPISAPAGTSFDWGDRAISRLEAEIQRDQEAGRIRDAIRAAGTLAELLKLHGRLQESFSVAQRALDWCENANAIDLETPIVSANLAAAFLTGLEREANSLLSYGLRKARQRGDVADQVFLLHRYAELLWDRFGPERAHDYSRRAARLARRIPSPSGERRVVWGVHSMILSALGRPQEAARWYLESLKEEPSLKLPMQLPWGFEGFKNAVMLGVGEVPESDRSLELISQFSNTTDCPALRIHTLEAESSVLWDRGEAAKSLETLAEALALAERLPHLSLKLEIHTRVGSQLLELRLQEQATDHFARARELAEQTESPLLILTSINHQARGLISAGDYEGLATCLSGARHVAQRVRHPAELARLATYQGLLHYNQQAAGRALIAFRRAVRFALEAIDAGKHPHQVGFLASTFDPAFMGGISIAMEIAQNCARALGIAIYFLDARQCIALRESQASVSPLRRPRAPRAKWRPSVGDSPFQHEAQPSRPTTGAPEPTGGRNPDPRRLFEDSLVADLWDYKIAKPLRRQRKTEARLGRPIGIRGCGQLIPDPTTVIVLITSYFSDLLYIPIRLDESGLPEIVTGTRNFLRLADGADAMTAFDNDNFQNELAHVFALREKAFATSSNAQPPTDSEILQQVDWQHMLRALAKDLHLDGLLGLIEPDLSRRQQLNLVLVPDRSVCRLPLQAAIMGDGRYLYQHVASLRHAHSLSVLRLQTAISESLSDRELKRGLRGVAFACPSAAKRPDGALRQLHGVHQEVEALLEETGSRSWWLHGDRPGADDEATCAHFLERHNAGNVLVAMGHGDTLPIYRDQGSTDVPCGATATFQMTDGYLTQARLQSWPFDFRRVELVFFSACFLGRLESVGEHEIDGFLTSLAMAGSRRILTALWDLPDESAPKFTRCLIRSLKEEVFEPRATGPHRFAAALRTAVDAFRSLDGGKYDHPYFWAPYVLYGLG
jgi:CHAT domain-containing protein